MYIHITLETLNSMLPDFVSNKLTNFLLVY